MKAFDVAELETMFVNSVTFAATSILVGDPELVEEILSKAGVRHVVPF